jgi:hypothetical protein
VEVLQLQQQNLYPDFRHSLGKESKCGSSFQEYSAPGFTSYPVTKVYTTSSVTLGTCPTVPAPRSKRGMTEMEHLKYSQKLICESLQVIKHLQLMVGARTLTGT